MAACEIPGHQKLVLDQINVYLHQNHSSNVTDHSNIIPTVRFSSTDVIGTLVDNTQVDTQFVLDDPMSSQSTEELMHKAGIGTNYGEIYHSKKIEPIRKITNLPSQTLIDETQVDEVVDNSQFDPTGGYELRVVDNDERIMNGIVNIVDLKLQERLQHSQNCFLNGVIEEEVLNRGENFKRIGNKLSLVSF